jgi:hypothetical protein
VAKVTRVSSQSSVNMMIAMPTMRTASVTRVITPDANISLTLSTSLVIRVKRRPTGMRSKNPARRDTTWS